MPAGGSINEDSFEVCLLPWGAGWALRSPTGRRNPGASASEKVATGRLDKSEGLRGRQLASAPVFDALTFARPVPQRLALRSTPRPGGRRRKECQSSEDLLIGDG